MKEKFKSKEQELQFYCKQYGLLLGIKDLYQIYKKHIWKVLKAAELEKECILKEIDKFTAGIKYIEDGADKYELVLDIFLKVVSDDYMIYKKVNEIENNFGKKPYTRPHNDFFKRPDELEIIKNVIDFTKDIYYNFYIILNKKENLEKFYSDFINKFNLKYKEKIKCWVVKIKIEDELEFLSYIADRDKAILFTLI